MVFQDDFGADPEPEAGAGEVFGGKEGLEDALAHFGGHAGAGVCDLEADAEAVGVAPVSGAANGKASVRNQWSGISGQREKQIP